MWKTESEVVNMEVCLTVGQGHSLAEATFYVGEEKGWLWMNYGDVGAGHEFEH